MAQATEQTAVRLDDETLKVVSMSLFQLYPPTNPAVLLKAMRDWYLEYGNGPVLKSMFDWLGQVIGPAPPGCSLDLYKEAQADFTQKTGLTNESFTEGGEKHGG